MALSASILRGASHIKPEIRLAQAVSQFEADLPSEQKAAFRTSRFQVHNSPPGVRDVMRLAAEVDRRASAKSAGGRGLAKYYCMWGLVVVDSQCHFLFRKGLGSVYERRAVSSPLSTDGLDLLTSQTTEVEARENSRFRIISNRTAEAISNRKKLEMNLRVLDSCSTYDCETTWKQIRKLGNATLFNRAPEYQKWKGRANPPTLVFNGKLGSGKSGLLASVIDDLNLHVEEGDSIGMGYFFCRHDIADSLKALTVIGSLARQLLRSLPDLSTGLDILRYLSPNIDIETIFRLLKQLLPPNYQAYIILDGVDECQHSEMKELPEILQQLQQTFEIFLCISFRIETDAAERLKVLSNFSIVLIPDDNPDTKGFIELELETCIQSGKLTIGHPALVLEIHDPLLDKAQGMFLWVSLQISCLCAKKTDEAIRQALADLPKDLLETFSRILRKSEGLGRQYQRRILKLITAALRPLTTDELREALSVITGDTVWNPARLINNIYLTLACCGCFVTVDEEELTIRLVHHSVKHFLLSGSEDSRGIPFTEEIPKREMAAIVVTYLNYGIFDTRLSTNVVPQIMIESAPYKVIRSTLGSSRNVRSIALRLLESRKKSNCNMSKVIAEAGKNRSILEEDYEIFSLLRTLFEEKPINISAIIKYEKTPSLWAEAMRHETISKPPLHAGNFDSDKLMLWAARRVVKCLSWVAHNGHENVVRLLLLDTGKVNANKRDILRSIAQWYVKNSEHDIFKLLGSHVNTRYEKIMSNPNILATEMGKT
ncbi:hypothetical protein G7Y89_g8066 [Cudoniella acicularis]|uniref:NACHT domain-containing protein n=1 Tax=Cudoniella acicularis TaxID=354080 RepID=A0A8H4RJC0_9HELO|nr:hypothetical protein G7Y89_g8066 [Cudoniella acicularis]